MKINIVEREGYSNRIVDWKIYVRKDLTVAKASEYYYEFIEENSFRPVSELVLPEDGELLKEAVAADSFTPLELVTVLSNLRIVPGMYICVWNRVNRQRTEYLCIRSHYRICVIWRIERYSWNRAF